MSHATLPKMSAGQFTDGFGIRRRQEAGQADGLVEILLFHERLSDAAGFEERLRDRVGRLANFRHASYARVRRVERTDGALALVSEVPDGARLSQILAVAERSGLDLDVNAALYLVRQLVPALVLLHQNARDVSHGALAPERVIVATGGRAVVAEYVLGAALEHLRLDRRQLWTDLRVALPPDALGATLDHRADVMQLGAIALALVLGRPLRDDDLSALPSLLASATETSAYGKREPISDPLRRWLARALQLDVRGAFESVLEAQLALDNVLSDANGYVAAPIALETFLTRYLECAARLASEPDPPVKSPEPEAVKPEAAAAANETPPRPTVPEQAEPSAPAAPYVPRPRRSRPAPALTAPAVPSAPPPPPELETPVGSTAVDAPELVVEPIAAETRQSPPASRPPTPTPTVSQDPPEPAGMSAPDEALREELLAADETTVELRSGSGDVHPRWRLAALALGALVLLQGAGLYWAVKARVVAATTGTLTIDSKPAGAEVRVDGEPRGITPLSLELSAGAHVVELAAGGEPRVIPLSIAAGGTVAQYIELANQVVTTGRLSIRSQPSGAAVLLDGQPRGTTPLDLADVPAGEHELVLESKGLRVRQGVTVAAGETADVAVPLTAGATVPTGGWVTFGVPYEMQVFENGQRLGTTVGRLAMPAGPHQLEIVSETLGFRTAAQVDVALGRVSRVPISLPKGVMHLNATPWAEVWLDGERAGETPLGNLEVTIGPHEIVFRHPELGERRHAATVTAGQPVRLSVDLTQP